MRLGYPVAFATALMTASAQAQTISTAGSADTVEWTPINAFNGEYHLSIPCSEGEIGVWRKKANPELAANGAGCIRKDYAAIAILVRNVRPDFFETVVSKSKGERLPPQQLAGHRIWRTLDYEDIGDVTSEVVELDKTRFLLFSFVAKPRGTAQSRVIVDRFLSSLEFAQ